MNMNLLDHQGVFPLAEMLDQCCKRCRRPFQQRHCKRSPGRHLSFQTQGMNGISKILQPTAKRKEIKRILKTGKMKLVIDAEFDK